MNALPPVAPTTTPPADRYAVLGHPVARSQSPFIQAEFARQTGQRLDYRRLHCPLDAFEAALAQAAGG